MVSLATQSPRCEWCGGKTESSDSWLPRRLAGALERQEFSLHYQPQVDLSSYEVIGAEALLRWDNPSFSKVAISEIVTILEQSGQIIDVGQWAAREACSQIQKWQRGQVGPTKRISINVSGVQFRTGRFPETLLRELETLAIDPSQIEIELTEGVLLENADYIIAQLKQLSNAGIRVALDDFGTGYSALAYMRYLPFDAIKIEQTFCREINNDSRSLAIVASILTLAAGFGIDCVAEGIETQSQLDALQDLAQGKQKIVGQGYLFSRPVQAAEMGQIFAARTLLPSNLSGTKKCSPRRTCPSKI